MMSSTEKQWPSRLITIPLVTYFILGSLIVYLNIGQTSWGKSLASLGQSIIPSISGTAGITPKPYSAALVLTLAWFFIPIMYVLIMTKARLLILSFEGLRPSALINIGSWAFSLIFILYVPSLYVPHGTGLLGRKIFIALGASDFFVVLWGFVILAVGWMVMLFMTLSAISFVRSLIQSNRGSDHE